MYQAPWGVHASQPSSQVGYDESDFAAARRILRSFSTDYDLEGDWIMGIHRGNPPALYGLLLLLLPNLRELPVFWNRVVNSIEFRIFGP